MFTGISLFPQAVIKEKVEITPTAKKNNSIAGSLTDHSFKAEWSWTPTFDPLLEGEIIITNDCGGQTSSSWTSGGYTSLEINPVRGANLSVLFHGRRWLYADTWDYSYDWDLPDQIFTISVDGVVQFSATYPSFPWLFGSDFNFSFLDPYLCFPNNSIFNINEENPIQCGERVWTATDPLTLTITQGAEYLSIFDMNSWTIIGATATFPFNNYSNYSFRTIKAINDSVSHFATVTAEINGFTSTSTIELIPNDFKILAGINLDSNVIVKGQTQEIDIDKQCDCGYLPDTTTYNIEIIKGAKYGKLIDPSTGNKTNKISGLYQYIGFASFDFTANMDTSSITDSVIIKISMSNAIAIPTTLTLTIQPPPLVVTISPPILGVGDTANVIIEERNSDGTIQNFPPDQMFELALEAGCGGGEILVADSLGSYFSSVQQPIKFLASDSIKIDSMLVKLRVGLIQNNSDESISTKKSLKGEKTVKVMASDSKIAGYKKLLAEKSNNKNLPKKIAGNNCAPANFNSTIYQDADVAVESQPELEIVFIGPNEIWPNLPNQTNGYNRGADQPGYNPYTNFKIQLQNGGTPLIGEQIKILIKHIPSSGGHHHTNALPAALCGNLYSNNEVGNPIVASTDQNGEIYIKLLSSQIAGKYIIEASLVSNNQLKSDEEFQVKVPNLFDFSTINPESMWQLTGSNSEHPQNH